MKKKMDNKGFSLVELIIVIAIMVVLVAVLAPQYLKYVERSRVSADTATANEFIDSMQVLASDADAQLNSGGSYTVTSPANDGTITLSGDLLTAYGNAGILDTSKTWTFQSTMYRNPAITIELRFDSTTNLWVVDDNLPN